MLERLTAAVLIVCLIAAGAAAPPAPGPAPASQAQGPAHAPPGSPWQPNHPRPDPSKPGGSRRPSWTPRRPQTEAPESGTWVLVGLGLLALPLMLRRRRSAQP